MAHTEMISSYSLIRIQQAQAAMEELLGWVLSFSQHRLHEEWDGHIQGKLPGPWISGNKHIGWKMALHILLPDEKWPEGQEYSDFIFSPRSIRACHMHGKCTIGITILAPGHAPFPVSVAHKLTPLPLEDNRPPSYKADHAYIIPLSLKAGYNTIGWSGHAPILYKQGVLHTRYPSLSFPGHRGSSFTTFSLNLQGDYVPNPLAMPIPYIVEEKLSPLHISVYNPEGTMPSLQLLSLLALGPVHLCTKGDGGLCIPSQFQAQSFYWLSLVNPD